MLASRPGAQASSAAAPRLQSSGRVRVTSGCADQPGRGHVIKRRQQLLRKATTVEIVVDDLSGPQIATFLDEHVQEMRSITPSPESKHALDLDDLRKPEVTF